MTTPDLDMLSETEKRKLGNFCNDLLRKKREQIAGARNEEETERTKEND